MVFFPCFYNVPAVGETKKHTENMSSTVNPMDFDGLYAVWQEFIESRPMFHGLNFSIFMQEIIWHRADEGNHITRETTVASTHKKPTNGRCTCVSCLHDIYHHFLPTMQQIQEFEYAAEYFDHLVHAWRSLERNCPATIVDFVNFVDRISCYCGNVISPGKRLQARRNQNRRRRRQQRQKKRTKKRQRLFTTPLKSASF